MRCNGTFSRALIPLRLWAYFRESHESAFNIIYIKPPKIGPFVIPLIRKNLDANGRVQHYHRESNNLLTEPHFPQFMVAPGTRAVALKLIVRVRTYLIIGTFIQRNKTIIFFSFKNKHRVNQLHFFHVFLCHRKSSAAVCELDPIKCYRYLRENRDAGSIVRGRTHANDCRGHSLLLFLFLFFFFFSPRSPLQWYTEFWIR